MRKTWLAALALLLSFCATVAQAAPDGTELDRRVQRVTEELRCLVCQNQTIADSHAELAIMLKNQVRDMLAKGRSDQEAVDFMVQRYGDFVLYRPPVKRTTWVLWFGPFLLLVAALGVLFARLRGLAHGGDAEGAPIEEPEPSA